MRNSRGSRIQQVTRQKLWASFRPLSERRPPPGNWRVRSPSRGRSLSRAGVCGEPRREGLRQRGPIHPCREGILNWRSKAAEPIGPRSLLFSFNGPVSFADPGSSAGRARFLSLRRLFLRDDVLAGFLRPHGESASRTSGAPTNVRDASGFLPFRQLPDRLESRCVGVPSSAMMGDTVAPYFVLDQETARQRIGPRAGSFRRRGLSRLFTAVSARGRRARPAAEPSGRDRTAPRGEGKRRSTRPRG